MYDFSAKQWDLNNITLSFSLQCKADIPVSFAGHKKHTCTYQVEGKSLEGQTRSWGKTLHLSFSHTGETALIPGLIQGFFHVFNKAKWNSHSNYFKMLRQFVALTVFLLASV